MKKIIAIAMCLLICMQPVTAYALDIQKVQTITPEELQERLTAEYPHTELDQYADAFCDAAETDDINVYFLVSIAVLESGNGRSKLAREHGNLFGMKRNGKYMRWDDKSGNHAEYSIYYEAYILRYRYIDRGADTVEAIGAIYCDEEWAKLVEGIWRKLEETE